MRYFIISLQLMLLSMFAAGSPADPLPITWDYSKDNPQNAVTDKIKAGAEIYLTLTGATSTTEFDDFVKNSTIGVQGGAPAKTLEALLQQQNVTAFNSMRAAHSINSINLISLLQDPPTGTIVLQLKDKTALKTYTVKVSPNEVEEKEGLIECTCTSDAVKTVAEEDQDSCGNNRIKTNFYGEDINYYALNQVVYVYDNNNDISKRGFFKVSRTKAGMTCEPVNFNKEKISAKNKVQFKIININRFMYDVSIADTLVEYDSEPSPMLNNFLLGDSNLLGGLMSSFNKTFGANSLVDEARKIKLSPELCELQCFLTEFNGWRAKLLQAYNPCSKFPCCPLTQEDYHKMANKLDLIHSLFAKEEPNFTLLNKSIDDAKNKIAELTARKKELDSMATDLKKIREKKPDDRSPDEVKKLQKGEELEALLKDDPLKELNEQLVALNKEMEAFKSLKNIFESLPTKADLNRAVIWINQMVESNQTYMTEITSLNGNRLDIIVNIKAKDSIGKLVPALKDFNYTRNIEIPIIWKPFISFSTGSFMGVSPRLQNKQYEWRALPTSGNVITSDSKYQLVESGYSLLPVGFAALANFQWKASRSFGLGPSAGVGLTIETKPRLGYLGGWSFYFGDLRQLAFTGGVMAMQVDQLKNTLLVGHIYDAKPDLDPEYYKELKTGLFVSLTYTPFKNHRKLRPESEKNKNKNTTDDSE